MQSKHDDIIDTTIETLLQHVQEMHERFDKFESVCLQKQAPARLVCICLCLCIYL